MTYFLGALAMLTAWLVDPSIVGNRAGLAALLAFVFAAAATIYALRLRMPRYAGDVAVVGSLVLIDLGLCSRSSMSIQRCSAPSSFGWDSHRLYGSRGAGQFSTHPWPLSPQGWWCSSRAQRRPLQPG